MELYTSYDDIGELHYWVYRKDRRYVLLYVHLTYWDTVLEY